jgi:hypothetical protein
MPSLAAPGVWRRSLSEREQDVNDALCGLPWETAMLLRPQLMRQLGVAREVAAEFRAAQRRTR